MYLKRAPIKFLKSSRFEAWNFLFIAIFPTRFRQKLDKKLPNPTICPDLQASLYTGYVTTKSRDRGVATSPPQSIICNTVQYEYDYQLGNQYERLRYEYSYDCFFVRFRFTQCNKKYGTRQDPCLQATTPCDRQTNKQTHTRDVKSGGCTDNAERTTQDS